ncbi:MAG: PAS domain S-box protein [Desulfobacterales bacterium]|nr:PAS domain S-box protein [Desulfobacterales bacterium]
MANKPTYQDLEHRIQSLEAEIDGLRRQEGVRDEQLTQYETVAANFPDIIWSLDGRLKPVYVTPSVQKHLGFSLAEVHARNFTATLVPSSRDQFKRAVQMLRLGMNPTMLDLEHRHKNGTGFWFETQISGMFDGEKKLTGCICVSRNIDRRKQAESALKLSNALFQTAFAISPDAVTLNRLRDGVCTMVNDGFAALTGYSREEVVGKTTEQLGIWADTGDLKHLMHEINVNGSIRNMEASFRMKSGEVRTGLMSANLIILNRQPYVLAITKDIDKFKRAREALKESEEKYRKLIETATDAIFILQDGQVKFPNPQAKKMGAKMGVDLEEHAFFEYVAPEDQNMILERHFRRLKGEAVPSTYNFRLLRENGEKFWVEVNAVMITWDGHPATLNFIRDIDDQKKLEAEFQHARKMEAVGTLAGAIAHNFNNLLMAIQGNVSLLLLDTEDDDPRLEEFKKIQEHVENGSQLTSQLLGYARKGKYRIRGLDLNELVTRTVATFRKTHPAITISANRGAELHTIAGDRSQLEHVMINLLNNAADAMPEGGELFIKTMNVNHGQIRRRNYKIKPGEYVLTMVADTGVGMAQKIQRRIFEPFFTTKELGRGTGLGLASAYGIIKGHGGYIDVDSQRGYGSTFFIYLPASSRKVDEIGYKDQSVIQGSGCILVVDDEPSVLDISGRMLKKLGFQVLEACSGRDAIRVFRENLAKIDLVILDMIMPDLGGGEVYDRMRDIKPGVKAILATGYSIDGEAARILKRGCDGVIQKPFSIDRLSRMIHGVLATAPGGGGRDAPPAENPPGETAPQASDHAPEVIPFRPKGRKTR